MNEPKFTPGPWAVWKLSPDSDPQQRVIVTTQDGEIEVCGIVKNEGDAYLIAAAPQLLAVCDAIAAAEGASGLPDSIRAQAASVAAAARGRQ